MNYDFYDFGYYAGKDLAYPARINKPRLPINATPADHRAYADRLEQFEKEDAVRKEALKEYNSTVADRMKQFENELRDDYDLSRLQFDVLWNHAWERGHSAGLRDVYYYFDEFYDMATEFARLEK